MRHLDNKWPLGPEPPLDSGLGSEVVIVSQVEVESAGGSHFLERVDGVGYR